MKTVNKILVLVLVSIFGFGGGILGSYYFSKKIESDVLKSFVLNENSNNNNVKFTNNQNITELPDFTSAAQIGTDAVVNVKTEYLKSSENDILYEFLFGYQGSNKPIEGTGSGVIISNDGYIVTNNHVVENATKITVTLVDKREFSAKVIGTDPLTDLALLKIEATDLTSIKFGNSDNIKVGQWVLAIGNPYSLSSTVTAGIISAKSRDISILKDKYAIESFIQTDAAVNPGNSGGALIDIEGNLIGINSAIASPTGSYAGYSFAIPINLVKKVIADLIEFGTVQRAYLGVKVANINEQVATAYKLSDRKGVLVTSFTENSSAQKAGLKEGDVILKVDSIEVNSVSELLEQVGRHRPKDIVTLLIKRNNDYKSIQIVLMNENGESEKVVNSDIFGAKFEDLSTDELREIGLTNGVKVIDLTSGKFMMVGVRKGYVIEKVNNTIIKDAKQLNELLSTIKGGVYIEGYYPETREKAYYAFGVK